MNYLKRAVLILLNSIIFSVAAFTIINMLLGGKLKIWEMVVIDFIVSLFYFFEREVHKIYLK
jgi:hypothetical protein